MNNPAPPKLGLCMEGNEEALFRHLERAVRAGYRTDGLLHYVEIGVAAGETHLPICRWLRDPYREAGGAWETLGLDVPGGWSLDLATLLRAEFRISVINQAPDALLVNRHRIVLATAPEVFVRHQWAGRIGFALVDGCHGASCVRADFLAIEPYVIRGGIVAFHDATAGCQGLHPQPHCGTGIAVRQALQELGLLGLEYRPGWRFREEVAAPHGCVFVERVD